MTYPLVVELAAEGIPVRLSCSVLGFSPQAFYKWRAAPVCERDLADAHLVNAIVDIHSDDPEFGYRFIADELEAAGHRVSERRVWRLCRDHQIWSTTTKKGRRGGKGRPGPAVHDDLVRRDFTAAAPDRVWLTDITEHPTSEGKLYCCAVKDVFSNRIVGWSIDDRMTASIAVRALDSAAARRGDVAGCVLHSDRGSQFRARKLHRALARHDMVGSMGQVGSAGDNAAMESFFALLQKNVPDRQRWTTRDELRIAIVTWIERTYHRRRRQAALGRLTPVEFETTMTDPARQAA
jgi:transposase InsO family protein